MRFSMAWADVAKQNNVLRIAVLGVTFVCVVVLMIALKFAFKEPLVIERGCFSAAASTQSQAQTPQEIEAFIGEAIAQRFNSGAAVVGDYFALEELKARDTEQSELARREIRQKVVVNSVAKQGDDYLVDADRILSVGKIRSAFQMPMTVSIAKATRTSGNPYGLVVLRVAPIKTEDKKDGK
ncbi:MAG: hypothetical protein AB7K68_06265 [Bacteriovoracia bacterium]